MTAFRPEAAVFPLSVSLTASGRAATVEGITPTVAYEPETAVPPSLVDNQILIRAKFFWILYGCNGMLTVVDARPVEFFHPLRDPFLLLPHRLI